MNVGSGLVNVLQNVTAVVSLSGYEVEKWSRCRLRVWTVDGRGRKARAGSCSVVRFVPLGADQRVSWPSGPCATSSEGLLGR